MRRATPRIHQNWLIALLVLALWPVPQIAAAESEEPEEVLPSGTARLRYQGQVLSSAGFVVSAQGPLFDLQAIADLLSVDLLTGPYGDSNSLTFEDRQFIVGPDDAKTIMVPTAAGGQEEVSTLSRRPVKSPGGLKVPVDFLDRSFGEQLGLQFVWDADFLELQIDRQEIRQLEVALNLVHQFGQSTLEIEFSQIPRYRVETMPGAVEIRLSGDRLDQPLSRPSKSDPLVDEIIVSPDRIRIELREGAAVAEPRLLKAPSVRLILEVFQQGESDTDVESSTREAVVGGGLRTIVLDPGHGGEESGAVGPSGTAEKDLALEVGRSLKTELERRLAVRVVLTRSTDVDVPFETRTAIANQNKADLFISLHFNASFGSRAHGAETYFLSREASDQLAAQAAEEENQVSGEAGPEVDLQMILWDLAQSFHLAESQRFARLVQEELNQTLDLRDRGVKQAPFRVLMGANMPAVLVELGFLSNPDEENKLQKPTYRAKLVDSLVSAIIRFKRQLEAQPDIQEEGI